MPSDELPTPVVSAPALPILFQRCQLLSSGQKAPSPCLVDADLSSPHGLLHFRTRGFYETFNLGDIPCGDTCSSSDC